jgi:hypothetical protein
MVIKKIDGDQIYVDWDHRPWLESNFILNSEWPPTAEALLALENALPKIDKGIPMPPRKPDQRRERKPSKWMKFLKSLKVGDSFLVEYPTANTVKIYARRMKIKLTWRYEGKGPNGMAQERVWRLE